MSGDLSVTIHTLGAVVEIDGLEDEAAVNRLLDHLLGGNESSLDVLEDIEVRQAAAELVEPVRREPTTRDAVLAFFQEGPVGRVYRVREVAQALDLESRRAWDPIAELVGQGLLIKCGPASYVLASPEFRRMVARLRAESEEPKTVKEQVRAFMQEHATGHWMAADVAASLELRPKAVHNALAALRREGTLARVRLGVYTWSGET